ncbi:MAG: hypothetical protein ACO1PN_10995 [Betaproteobacteria bacterium]
MVTLTGTPLQLLPLAVNFAISFLFLSTLRHGKTPLITAIAMIESGAVLLPPELVRYTRRLTAVWGIFLILLGAKHLILEWPQGWWIAALLADSVAIGLFFLLEFALRKLNFPGRTFASPWTLFRLIQQQGGLFRLYRQCMT